MFKILTFLFSIEKWNSKRKGNFSGLSPEVSIPDAVNLLTLEVWNENSVILRLENMFETSENDEIFPVELPSDAFVGFEILDLSELSLGADRPIEETFKRLNFGKNGQNVCMIQTCTKMKLFMRIFFQKHPFGSTVMKKFKNGKLIYVINLPPMAIRTFKMDVRFRN